MQALRMCSDAELSNAKIHVVEAVRLLIILYSVWFKNYDLSSWIISLHLKKLSFWLNML